MRQLLLDLFFPPPSAPTAPAAPVQPVAPPAVAPAELPATPVASAAPDAPPAWAHPQASRHIALGEVVVAYALHRRRRRSIGLSIGPEGLSVSAPHFTAQQEIEAVLQQKARWILSKLAQVQQHQQRLHATRIDWREGASLPYLGRPITLRLDPRQRHGPAGAVLDGEALHIGLPHSATPAQLRDVCQAWLMRQARRLFTQKLDHFAPQLGVRWQRMSLSSAATRWGSASADGSIRLNWRLIHLDEALIDYVVVHELAHLREMNHSPRFWQHVHSVLPDYAARRQTLKGETVPLLDLMD